MAIMRVVCAPDSFKESLTAAEAADAMRRGVLLAAPAAGVDVCPIADGGEGTVAAMLAATGGEAMMTRVDGPLGDPVDATWGMLGNADATTAVIEMAAASGLPLVPVDQRDPTRTSTRGTGQLIKAALDAGARRIIVGIGGSATNDGGAGMAQALGVRFIDASGNAITQPMTGGLLSRVARIEVSCIDPRVANAQITAACDVTNPLTGPRGAAAVYGPQKGATPEQVKMLDDGLSHLAHLLRKQLGVDVQQLPGAGAAGGLGGGLVAFVGAALKPGIDLVLDAIDFSNRVAGASLCLTGEGRLDGQSLSGKACLGVAQRAGAAGVPTIALVGSVGDDADRTLGAGLASYHAIGQGLPVDESMRRAAELLERATARVVADFVSTGVAPR
jgi:glycerate kinase